MFEIDEFHSGKTHQSCCQISQRIPIVSKARLYDQIDCGRLRIDWMTFFFLCSSLPLTITKCPFIMCRILFIMPYSCLKVYCLNTFVCVCVVRYVCIILYNIFSLWKSNQINLWIIEKPVDSDFKSTKIHTNTQLNGTTHWRTPNTTTINQIHSLGQCDKRNDIWEMISARNQRECTKIQQCSKIYGSIVWSKSN